MMKRKVLLINPTIQPIGVNLLKQHAEVILSPDGSEESLISYLSSGDISAVITRVERITKKIIDASNGLRVIGQHGVGVDNIDIRAATNKGVLVINAPISNYLSTAEHAVMFMLALTRRLRDSDSAVRAGNFQFRESFYPDEINGKNLFVIGCGRIGSEVARKCRIAFNMHVYGFDPYVSDTEMRALGIQAIGLEEGLKIADFTSIHVSLTPETSNLINSSNIRFMKESSYLVNCSRGAVINQTDLFEALKNNKIRSTGLDVFKQEPPDRNDPVLFLANVLVTPHFAGDTFEAKQRCSQSIAEDVIRVLNGQLPRFIVNSELFKSFLS